MATSARGDAERALDRERAWAEAFITIGRALTTLGLRLRDADAAGAPPAGAPQATLPVEVASAGVVPRGGLGPRQQAVLNLGGFVTTEGLSAADVATALGLNQANALNVLKRLQTLGYLTPIVGERPARWRRVE